MVSGSQPVESSLHKHLIEHLNAEVAQHTITDLGVAMEWLTSTFLYIRARKNPKHYGLPIGLSSAQVDKKLLEMCQIEINRLARSGMLTIDAEDITVTSTPVGTLMAKYYVAFDTMKLFTQVTGREALQQILGLISRCKEFSDMYLRVNDKKPLNILNKCSGKPSIRFPLNGKIKTLDMKVNCIIQAEFGCLKIVEASLINESQKIMRIGERISSCLADYLSTRHGCFSALLSSLTLVKCFRAKLWENSPYVSKQLTKIGNAFATAFVNAEKVTFQQLLESNPRDLERIINRKPPMGNAIQQQIEHLPRYTLGLNEEKNDIRLSVNLKITLLNASILQTECTVPSDSLMTLLIGDSNNDIILIKTFKHKEFIHNPSYEASFNFHKNYAQEIKAHFISENWVGIDCETYLNLSTSSVSKDLSTETPTQMTKEKPNQSQKPPQVQMCVDNYFKKSKTCKSTHNKNNCNSPKNSEYNIVSSNDQSENESLNVVTSFDSPPCKDTTFNLDDSIISSSRQAFVQTIVEEANKEFTQKVAKKSITPTPMPKKYLTIQHMNSVSDCDSVKTNNRQIGIVTQFKYQPPTGISKFSPPTYEESTCTDTTLMEDSMEHLEIPCKSNNVPLQKTISWRSPLITTSLVKHSPIVQNQRETRTEYITNASFGINKKIDVTQGIPCSTAFSNSDSLSSQTSVFRPRLKMRNRSKGVPLADGEYVLRTIEENPPTNLSYSNGIEDLISSSLLETLQTNVDTVSSTSVQNKRIGGKCRNSNSCITVASREKPFVKRQVSPKKCNVETQTNLPENEDHNKQRDSKSKAKAFENPHSTSSSSSETESQKSIFHLSQSSSTPETLNEYFPAYDSTRKHGRQCFRDVSNLQRDDYDNSTQYPPSPRKNFYSDENSLRQNFSSYNRYSMKMQPVPNNIFMYHSQPSLPRPRKRAIPYFNNLLMRKRQRDLQEPGPSSSHYDYQQFPGTFLPPMQFNSYPYTNPNWPNIFQFPPKFNHACSAYDNGNQYPFNQYLNPFRSTDYENRNILGQVNDTESDEDSYEP